MKKSFLFLQGPHGPFFSALAQEIVRRGHDVLRINFNGGDWFDWKHGRALRFRGGLAAWEAFCLAVLREHHITDLVLYGDCRPLHRQAVTLAEGIGIRIHVFEEGYIRPDWVTLEEGGVNGYSRLPRSGEWYLRTAGELASAPHVETGPSLHRQVRHCVIHYAAAMLFKPLFPLYRTHRPCHPAREVCYWLRRLPRLRREKIGSRLVEEQLLASGNRYFIVCLQISFDSQITCHSPFKDMVGFIETVIESFVRHAPGDCHLVFKNHPLDHGGVDYLSLIAARGAAHGQSGRFHFLEGGRLPDLLKGAQGVVLVNSTVGTSALFHGRPTIALGACIYNFAGLTFQGGLDDFWRHAEPPDPAIFAAFRRYLLANVLINGGFYTPAGRALLLAGTLPRLLDSIAPFSPVPWLPVLVQSSQPT